MSRKYTKDELQANREQFIKEYYAETPRSAKKPVLTKKERKVLGIGRDRGVARAKHSRISPSKVSIVVRTVINRQVDEAIAILKYTPKAAAPILIQLLEEAAANAVNNNNLNRDDLYFTDCQVGPGVTMKRFMPRGKGSANRILKRSSNISVTVKGLEEAI